MAIKPLAQQNFFDNYSKQLELAKRLDEAFDVTFGHSHGELFYWLAEPKEHMKERFGLNKEVLVIYSLHERTDARVLTAIENISRNPDVRHRIDKVMVLLIHRGNVEETRELVIGQAEWIIIPFHADEIMDSGRGTLFIRSRISEYAGTVDLFGVSSPIKSDKYLFGRDELVQTLINRSIMKQESSGLFGLRKTGKTSVLFALQRRLAERSILVEYVDCQNPGIHAARWWQVLEDVSKRLHESLRTSFKRTCKLNSDYLLIGIEN